MKIFNKQMPDNFNLFLFGDDHMGSILRSDDGWNSMIDQILSKYDGCKNNYCVDSGDCIEAIQIDDPRYDGVTTEGNIIKQIDDAVKCREAIKDKILVIMEGNHPLKLWRFGNITEKVCERLGVDYGTWSCIINYKHKKSLMFKHFAAHGFSSINSNVDDPIRRKANMKISLKRMLREKSNAYLSSMGHTHKLLISKPESSLVITDHKSSTKQFYSGDVVKQNAAYTHPDLRWYVNTGSFYRTYAIGVSGYAEIKGYNPIEIGYCIAKIRDRKLVDIDKIVL